MPKMSLLLLAICVLALIFGAAWLRATPMIAYNAPAIPSGPLNNDRLIGAIEVVENWDGTSIGAEGERGPWQMSPRTWRQYAAGAEMPFTRNAWLRPGNQSVVYSHASWIRDQMEAHRLPQNAYTFGLIWNAGLGRVLNNRTSLRERAYAQRVQNVYDELHG